MSGHKNWVSKRTCVYNIGYHIVWSTKYRRNVLSGAVEKRLKELFQEIAIDFGFEVSEFEVMPDHCHLFVTCHPKYSPSDIVKQLKGITARKLFLEFPKIKEKLWGGHLWNPSYSIGTAGDMSKDVVLRYIQNQKTEEVRK